MELSKEQKKLFKLFCKYLGTFGTKYACIDFNIYNEPPDMDTYTGWKSPDIRKIKIEGFEEINDLVEDITIKYLEDIISFDDFSGEVEFCVDCLKKTIHMTGNERVYDTEWTGEEWELSEVEELESWSDFAPQITGYDEGVVSYEGSGDSGYIEDNMVLDDDEQITIPGDLEGWMYKKLGSYGGWEINEGSQGKFIFDFANGKITLNHGENYEKDVVFDVDFKKSFEIIKPT